MSSATMKRAFVACPIAVILFITGLGLVLAQEPVLLSPTPPPKLPSHGSANASHGSVFQTAVQTPTRYQPRLIRPGEATVMDQTHPATNRRRFAVHRVKFWRTGLSQAPQAAKPVDFDGDGDIDIITAYGRDGQIVFLENRFNGRSWRSHLLTSIYRPEKINVMDTGGDWPEIACQTHQGLFLIFRKNQRWGSRMLARHQFGAAVSAADINHDGVADIISVSGNSFNPLDNQFTWFFTVNGGKAWQKGVIARFSTADYPISGFPADMDGDGDVDVVGGTLLTDRIVWYENQDGMGGQWSPHLISQTATRLQSLYAADVDGDMDMDVVAAVRGADAVVWWENQAYGWIKHIIDPRMPMAWCVKAEDLDGDGDTDIIAGSRKPGGKIVWYENLFVGGWAEHFLSDSRGIHDIQTADMNMDGRLDVLTACPSTIQWFEQR